MESQISMFDDIFPEYRPLQEGARWILGIDNGAKMLGCSSCGCRVIRKWYDRAVGDLGFRYCPYCGKEMVNAEDMVVPWPGYVEEEKC